MPWILHWSEPILAHLQPSLLHRVEVYGIKIIGSSEPMTFLLMTTPRIFFSYTTKAFSELAGLFPTFTELRLGREVTGKTICREYRWSMMGKPRISIQSHSKPLVVWDWIWVGTEEVKSQISDQGFVTSGI